jgi:hypothetical protein
MFPDFRKYYYLWPVALLALILGLTYGGYLVSESEPVQRLVSNVNFVLTYDQKIKEPNIPDSIEHDEEKVKAFKLAHFRKNIEYPLAKIDKFDSTIFNPNYRDSIRLLLFKLDTISTRIQLADTITRKIDAQIDSLIGISNTTLSLDSLNQDIDNLTRQLDTLQKLLESQSRIHPDPRPGLRRRDM